MNGAPKQALKVACGSVMPRFRSSNLRGIPGNEVVHRLLWRQLRDRRQHTKRVGRQKDNVLRVASVPSG